MPPTEVVHGALGYAAAEPGDDVILVGDPERIAGIAGSRTPAGQRPGSSATQVIEMDEHPALALREKKDASILVATDLVQGGQADAVVTAGHTGAGIAAAMLRLGRLPGVDRPALAVRWSRRRDRSSCSTSGPTPTRRARTSTSTPTWARSSPRRSSGVARPARCAAVDRRGDAARATPASSAPRSSSRGRPWRFTGNIEGKDLVHHMADVVVCDAVLGNVDDQVLRGPVKVPFRPDRGASSAGRRAAPSRMRS